MIDLVPRPPTSALKIAAQWAMSVLPRSHDLNYVMQRHVSRRLPRGEEDFVWRVGSAMAHVRAWEAHGDGRDLGELSVLEIGAGYDLTNGMALWAAGVGRQLLVDLNPVAREPLVRLTAGRMRAMRGRLEEVAGRPLRELPADVERHGTAALRELGIEYRAPLDARRTGLPAGSLDLVLSNFTLEHVPPADIVALLAEGSRLLREGGIASHQIDMKDHFSYVDGSVGPFDFLRYGPGAWRLRNPPLHHLNRLRWPEYEALLRQAPVAVLAAELTGPDPQDVAAVRALPPAGRFRRMPAEGLAVREAHVVLAPAAVGATPTAA
jgi:SAM-dependent methyltransferase